jgi:predicted phosphodiesterase
MCHKNNSITIRLKGEEMNTMTKKASICLVFVLAFAMSSTAFAGILKWPYLIYPGLPGETGQYSQMQVIWQNNDTGETNVVSWGTDTTYSMGTGTATVFGPDTVDSQQTYTITGLAPSTTYYYQVSNPTSTGSTVYGTGSFITAPFDNATSVRFIGMGDSRSQPFALDNIMQAMNSFYSQPGNGDYRRLVIHNGDWVSSDGESYWTTQWFVPTMTDIMNFTQNSPINGVKGNHDNSGTGYSTTFPKYFPFPYPNATLVPGTAATYNNLYWSFDYGPVHFTLVDEYSSFAPGSAQYNWLVNDLATTTKPWKILIYHEPAYSAGSDADNTAVRALEPLITQYNVDLVYSGHSHNYARTGVYNLAQANGDQIALNVPHFTSGGGGAPVYQPDMTNKGSYPHVITAWPAYEFIAFDVEGETLTMTSYQVNGGGNSAITSKIESNLTISPIETIVLNHFTDVSAQISVSSTGFLYSRASKLYTGSLTITNNGPSISGNIDIVLDGIVNLQGIGNADDEYASPPLTSKIAQNTGLLTNVTLVNATSSNNGEPMIRATTNGLNSGDSITIPLQFSNPSNVMLNFNPRILQE